jgi:hypothetical protein
MEAYQNVGSIKEAENIYERIVEFCINVHSTQATKISAGPLMSTAYAILGVNHKSSVYTHLTTNLVQQKYHISDSNLFLSIT